MHGPAPMPSSVACCKPLAIPVKIAFLTAPKNPPKTTPLSYVNTGSFKTIS